MKETLVIIAVTLAVVAIPLCIIAQFSYLTVWGNNADFENYKTEFILIKNFVEENISQGKDLYFDSTHTYDLYDFDTKQYLNCPEDVRTALETISHKASRSAETRFNEIKYKNNKIIFGIETVGYAVVYSPDEVPYDALGDRPKKEVHCKRIQKGWYHVALYR